MKKSAFYFVAAIITVTVLSVSLEVVFGAYYLVRNGGYISVNEMLDNEQNSYIQEMLDGNTECKYLDALFPHPYLGFVYHGKKPCGTANVNRSGMLGVDYPLEKQKDKFVVLVTGGSVAAQFVNAGYLGDILNKSADLGGKEVVILNGGLGGWKQPQQAILLLLYGEVIDAVITIDGFNELDGFHFFKENKSGARFEVPAKNFIMVNPAISTSYEKLMGIWIYSSIYRYSKTNFLLSKSFFSYFVTKRLRDMVRIMSDFQHNSSAGVETFRNMFSLPSEWSFEKTYQWQKGQYKKYISATHALAKHYGLKSAFFIQPVPAISKKLSEEEIRTIKASGYTLEYKKPYLEIVTEVLKVKGEGVPVFSLLDIFAEEEGTIYADAVHCKFDPATGANEGYRIMAEIIADTIIDEWGMAKK